MSARHIPVLLTGLRAFLAPVVVALAVYAPIGLAFGACLVVALLSDIFDGVIARRLQVATPTLRRLDSAADTLFYGACLFAALWLHPTAIFPHLESLGVLALLEVARYVFDLVKFRREASYHMWSSKLWGLSLFLAFFTILAIGRSGPMISVAIYLGIIADLEGIAISAVLPRWQSDIPSIAHAIRLRNSL